MEQIISSADIGRKIKCYRQKSGLTQEKLAEILSVSFQQVQNYENGKTKLNTDKLQQICHAINISPTALFSEEETRQHHLSPQEEKLLNSFRSIKGEEKKDCVVILADALRKHKTK